MESTCLTDLPQKKNGGAGEIQSFDAPPFCCRAKRHPRGIE
jgi:hypothetical protein